MKELADRTPPIRGAKGRYAAQVEADSFKDVSVFTELFTEDWDMMNRVAADPAHEFHNLVKDILSLICNKGNMALKAKRLAEEKKIGRFQNVATPSQAPWLASNETLRQVEQVVSGVGNTPTVLRVPYGWPMNVNYFGEDIKKGKGTLTN
jgi:hypothetical protein